MRTTLAVLCGVFWAGAAAADCAPDRVDLRGDWGSARFTVEVVDTVPTRAQGLMHRESMPKSAGMLFVYDRDRPVTFWMKNVAFPLDLMFIDSSGRIAHIVEEAEPDSTAPIASGVAVGAVLEIRGGASRRAQIRPGHTVSLAPSEADREACLLEE